MRIAIAGVPRAGKTWYARLLQQQTGHPIVHGDDFIAMGWSEASAEIARRLVSPGPYIVEGVVVIRGLRKALDFGPERPCDVLHWLGDPRETLRPAQANMGAQDAKRLSEIESELLRRGVRIVAGVTNYDRNAARAVVPQAASRVAPASTPAPMVEAPVQAAPVGSAGPTVASPYAPAGESRWSGSPGRGFG